MTASERKEMRGDSVMGGMGILIRIIFFLVIFTALFRPSEGTETIELKNGPEDLAWVVQLSDLHFSVHHPDRAQDFKEIVGPALSFIKPALVLITGDLTDGKSKDLVVMKQDEEEWIEYRKVMRDVVKRSGLNESSFYDVRGNHDNFGVPSIGGSYDFFSKYSFNGLRKRSGHVNSITIQTSKRKVLFVGFDSTMPSGLRGPTNLFGHPTDELLTDINSELSQWDSQSSQPVIKVSFGHFPLSFSEATKSGKTLKATFLMHSLSAYLCGHLHTKFGKNLKRYHSSHHQRSSKQLFQLNGHRFSSEVAANCSSDATKFNEFWEWEMGDWRKSRAMRILAIDGGHISFVDIDFKLGAKKTIILPTFPLDSRFTSKSSQCRTAEAFYREIRALVFSTSPIISVVARIYDSSSGNLLVVMETLMTKLEGSRGDLYGAPWNIKAFEDPFPERYLLQIETTDIAGRSTVSDLRPFSVSGLPAKHPWNWKEFFVMGCQWDGLYLPIFWCFYLLVLSILLIPKALLSFSRRHHLYKNLKSNKGFINSTARILVEIHNVPVAWCCMIVYLFYLVLCPWFSGQFFNEGGELGYMTYRGVALKFKNFGKMEFLGFPDAMVIVLPHLYFILFPSLISIIMLAAERGLYHDYIISLSSKKNDDTDGQNKEAALPNKRTKKVSELILHKRWLRKFFLVVSLAISWKHLKNCRGLMRAYETNPFIHSPIYSLAVPLLLAYTIWKTRKA
ncbi:putative metallophosphoesterase At3g03305 [Henckelia pumila]|uniref:putative metallophosphoesterase At3g03305 n=1 Tax=Henckelia pumila TaxID=405737 RepID=UPI003C6E53BF